MRKRTELAAVARRALPKLAVPKVSERLSEYLDPSRSQRSWTEALALARKLNESAWVNSTRGELGLVGLLQGDTNTAIVNLGRTSSRRDEWRYVDTSSLVRWLTLLGHGFVELGRPEQASTSTSVL